jgi:hypothetical protein
LLFDPQVIEIDFGFESAIGAIEAAIGLVSAVVVERAIEAELIGVFEVESVAVLSEVVDIRHGDRVCFISDRAFVI